MPKIDRRTYRNEAGDVICWKQGDDEVSVSRVGILAGNGRTGEAEWVDEADIARNVRENRLISVAAAWLPYLRKPNYLDEPTREDEDAILHRARKRSREAA